MKQELYQAKVQSLLNEMVTASERYMQTLSMQQDRFDQIWNEQNLRLKDYEQNNSERLRIQLQKDKQWIELVEENQKLEILISNKILSIKQKAASLPKDISEFTNSIAQISLNPQQAQKQVLRTMTQEVLLSYNTVKQAEQNSAQF